MAAAAEVHAGTTGSQGRLVASALIVRSSEDDDDCPVPPVLVEGDGQPSGLGRALWTLVRRDGYQAALDTLERGAHWLVVSPEPVDAAHGGEPGGASGSGGATVAEAGYGLRFRSDEGTRLARLEVAEEADQVWWYLVEQRGVLVEHRRDRQRRAGAFVTWDDPAPQWAELDSAASGGQHTA